MDAERIDTVERQIDRGASALFAAAVGYAAYGVLRAMMAQPALVAAAGTAIVAGYLLSRSALKAVAGTAAKFDLPAFTPVEFVESAAQELLLTDRVVDELLLTEADRVAPGDLVLTRADRLIPEELLLTEADVLSSNVLVLTDRDRLPAPAPEPLELDDILAELGPNSRVVRLFDPAAMPTPGQLKGRIDDHLRQGAAAAPQPDAAQALSDALDELRRSLR